MRKNTGCLFNLLLVFALFGYGIAGVSGALFGVLLALCIHYMIPQRKSSYSNRIDHNVLEALTKLSWITMKADEGISQSELYVFRDYMLQHFGSEATAEAIEIMQALQYQRVSSREAAFVIHSKLNYSEKMQILQFLFQLAAADGEIHLSEMETLRQIAEEMSILQTDFIYLKNAYDYIYRKRYSGESRSYQNQYSSSGGRGNSLENAYAILGVKSTDSDEVIKAAYRRLAIANHPDKVQHLGETAHNEAEKRFSEINEAYNRVKKARK